MIYNTTDFKEKKELAAHIRYAYELIDSGVLDTLPSGRHVFENGVFCLIQEYDTKPLPEQIEYEVHRLYADLQYIAEGEELMALCEFSDVEVTKPWDPDSDKEKGILREGAEQTLIPYKKGESFVLVPGEAHMPQFDAHGSSHVRKYVFKLPAE